MLGQEARVSSVPYRSVSKPLPPLPLWQPSYRDQVTPGTHLRTLLDTLEIPADERWLWLTTDGLIPQGASEVPMLGAVQLPDTSRPGRLTLAWDQPWPWASAAWAHWPLYSFEVLARVVPPPTSKVPWPYLQFELPLGDKVATWTFQLWWQHAGYGAGSLPWAELAWRPGWPEPEETVGGVTLRERAVRRKQADNALALLHRLPSINRPGRKPGKRDVSYEDVVGTYHDLRMAHDGERPSQEDVAEKLATSADTIYRVCRDDARGWPPSEPQG
jgi:hypothetical protein